MYKIYQGQGPLFLFESVEGGERWGRYSFMGISARYRIKVFNEHVVIENEGQPRKIRHGGDPFGVLRDFMGKFRPANHPELPRFWGGLVGYLSYESVSFIEKIPNRLPPEEPLARFCVPDALLIFDNVRHTLSVLAIAFLSEGENPDAVYDQAHSRVAEMVRMVGRPCHTEGKPAVTLDSWKRGAGPGDAPALLSALRDPDEYRRRVVRAKEYIRAGDIIQAVISQPFCCPAPVDPLTLYRAQRYINPSPYLYFLHLDEQVLVGSSPETMVRLENQVATLRPIAGTRPRGATEQADRALADELLKDDKERAEHLMLVDLGRNDLGRVARTGTVQVTDLLVVERYSHVMHLVSNICADLKPECDAWDLFKAAFPAGTLSGAPKVRAMEIIAELEQSPRGAYGGAVGYISFSGNMDLAIVIRTAQIAGDRLTLRAGAGIVADSDPESERLETLNKARAIERALALVGAHGG
jgi:anthranilate synthase component 1